MNSYLKRAINPQLELAWKPATRKEIYGEDDSNESLMETRGKQEELDALVASQVVSDAVVTGRPYVDNEDEQSTAEVLPTLSYRLIGSGVRRIKLVEEEVRAVEKSVTSNTQTIGADEAKDSTH